MSGRRAENETVGSAWRELPTLSWRRQVEARRTTCLCRSAGSVARRLEVSRDCPPSLVRVVESNLQPVQRGRQGRNGNCAGEIPINNNKSCRQPMPLLQGADVSTETVGALNVYEVRARSGRLKEQHGWRIGSSRRFARDTGDRLTDS